jgi:transcriptional regulator with XRE-family HTH domain
MGSWRALDDYTPFARTLVEYMWRQRPPLLPNQFADRAGVRKQALSTWLNGTTVPAPLVVVRLARTMGLPVRQLLVAADYATEADPLLDIADAWAYVRAQVEQAVEQGVAHVEQAAVEAAAGPAEAADGAADEGTAPAAAAATRGDVLALLDQLQERARAGRPSRASTLG